MAALAARLCRGNMVASTRMFSTHRDPFGTSGKSQQLTEKQKALMARGLPKKSAIPGVERVVLVASGKGGVGKSTTAVNLAVALSEVDGDSGVGVLDLDVFGSSIPRLMNLSGNPEVDEDDNLVPLSNFGIKCMSMGFLVSEEAPVVWRGPMVMSAVQRLLLRTAWGRLGYLVVDMPPGTGDTQLSMSQLVQVTGAVVVSTPQDLALADARKGAAMFRQVGIPLLGLVQNMSVFTCSNCGHREHVFGRDGAVTMAREMGVEVLGDVALSPAIMKGADGGRPIVLTHPDSPQAQCYVDIAKRVVARINALPTNSETG